MMHSFDFGVSPAAHGKLVSLQTIIAFLPARQSAAPIFSCQFPLPHRPATKEFTII